MYRQVKTRSRTSFHFLTPPGEIAFVAATSFYAQSGTTNEASPARVHTTMINLAIQGLDETHSGYVRLQEVQQSQLLVHRSIALSHDHRHSIDSNTQVLHESENTGNPFNRCKPSQEQNCAPEEQLLYFP
jgi:hypothetical protein